MKTDVFSVLCSNPAFYGWLFFLIFAFVFCVVDKNYWVEFQIQNIKFYSTKYFSAFSEPCDKCRAVKKTLESNHRDLSKFNILMYREKM